MEKENAAPQPLTDNSHDYVSSPNRRKSTSFLAVKEAVYQLTCLNDFVCEKLGAGFFADVYKVVLISITVCDMCLHVVCDCRLGIKPQERSWYWRWIDPVTARNRCWLRYSYWTDSLIQTSLGTYTYLYNITIAIETHCSVVLFIKHIFVLVSKGLASMRVSCTH